LPLPLAPVDLLPLAPSPAAPCLQTQALAGERGDRRLFEGLNLALVPGSVTWLRGRNGRGKTSLLRVLAGLSPAADGSVSVHGQAQTTGDAQLRRQWVYIGHQNALKDDLTATEALSFLARLHGLPHDDETLIHALRQLGIGHRRHAMVRTLSQGQRRRVALARLALSGAAPIWLLDEPYDALDIDGIAVLDGIISAHAAAGGCVLLTSHQTLTIQNPVPQLLDLEPYAPQPTPKQKPKQKQKLKSEPESGSMPRSTARP
jgi:heme exporter protein A